MNKTVLPSVLAGTVCIPPSKSAAHRAIIAAALAKGKSIISNIDLSDDIIATTEGCKSLGCDINIANNSRSVLTINGGLASNQNAAVDCRESGSTLRFLLPLACALGGRYTFTGTGRLPKRPISEYLRIFAGQEIKYAHPEDANLPLCITGKLRGADFMLDGRVSSQYVTGLLLCLPLLDADSSITIKGGLESRGYVDLSVYILSRFGIDVDAKNDCFYVSGNQKYLPQNLSIEGDYSQAAFFLVGGAIAGEVRIEGLAKDSLQPDSAIVQILRKMGADITRQNDTLIVKKSKLHGISVDVSQYPDLVPPLAIAAAFAKGDTNITGALRLRIKESDRLSALAYNLTQLGIKTAQTQSSLTITGGRAAKGKIDSFGDHRIAMAFAIAAAASDGGISIKGAQSVEKSYPKFFEDFKALGGYVL